MHVAQQMVKIVDDSGRITIGKEFSGKNCTIQKMEDGTVVITPVCLVPEREMWFFQNPEAMKALDDSMNSESIPMTLDELIDL